MLAFLLFTVARPLAVKCQTSVEIVQKVGAAEAEREQKLLRYSVSEHYQIFQPGNDVPVADASYKATYVNGHGKTYDLIGEPIYRKLFIETAVKRLIEGQKRASQPEARRSILPTPDNYSMVLIPKDQQPQPAYICTLDRRKRNTRVLAIKPLHEGIGLIEGYLWVDETSFHLVRIQGRLTTSPDVFVGKALVERDYDDIGNFAMATSSCQLTQGLFSTYRSQITYAHYDFLNR